MYVVDKLMYRLLKERMCLKYIGNIVLKKLIIVYVYLNYESAMRGHKLNTTLNIYENYIS